MTDSPLLTNPEAEQALLGAILANNRGMSKAGTLQPHHFAYEAHQRIFEAMQRRIDAGSIADAITLRDELYRSGTLEQIGGVGYLATLLTAMVSPFYVEPYAEAILEAYRRRTLQQIGDQIRQASEVEDVAAIITQAQQALQDVAPTSGRTSTHSLGEAIDAALAQADAVARGEVSTGIKTGMSAIDAALGGIEAQEMMILGGRPGSGKSALGHKWAINIARDGGGVLEISQEMSAASLGRRALCAASGVPIQAMRRGEHGPHMDALIEARRELYSLPVTIEDGGRATAADMMAMALKAKRKHGLKLILVDHLQIAKPDEADIKGGANAGVAGLAHAMKEMAKRLEVPVLALSQLNRGLLSREDQRPNMGDLRQAGAIEEDADIVAFVHRPELFMPKSAPERQPRETDEKHAQRVSDYFKAKNWAKGKAEFIIEKLREGEPVTVPLLFDGPTTNFTCT